MFEIEVAFWFACGYNRSNMKLLVRPRSKFTSSVFALIVAASVGYFLPSGGAAVVITTNNINDGSVYTVSNSDLFQTNLSSVTSTGGFAGFANNSLSLLTNGSFGAPNTSGVDSVAPDGATITFSFDLLANPLGYDITGLTTYAGWDSGRDGQEYTVSYSTVSAPNTFQTLVMVPQFNPTGIPFSNAHTRVGLTDSSGLLAGNVAAIRYSFTSFENSGTAYREIDAFGSPSVPEPGSVFLIALGALVAGGITKARRRKRVS